MAIQVSNTHVLCGAGKRLVFSGTAIVAASASDPSVLPGPLLSIQCRLEMPLCSCQIVASRVEVYNGGATPRKPNEELDTGHGSSNEVLHDRMA